MPSVEDVGNEVSKIGLVKYVEIFKEFAIDGYFPKLMENFKLKELGVETNLEKKRIQAMIWIVIEYSIAHVSYHLTQAGELEKSNEFLSRV